VAYVLNGTTVDTRGGLERLASRFAFVRKQNPGVELAVFLSRPTDPRQHARLSAQLGLPVHPFLALDDAGAGLSVEGVLAALCALVQLSDAGESTRNTDAVAAEQLLRLLLHLRACGGSDLWTSALQLYRHMADDSVCGHRHDDEEKLAAPLSHVLGRFSGAARFLAGKNHCVCVWVEGLFCL
jgi:hypothetical protein